MSTPEITLYNFEQLESTASVGTRSADVLSEAWAEAERVRETARSEGEAAGFSEGLARAQAHAAPLADALAAAIADLEQAREQAISELVEQAAELSIAIAEQVLSAHLETRPDHVVDIARGALRRISDRHRITIIVNPEDLELLTDASGRLQGELGGIEHLDVQADRRIDRGGAIARTPEGEVDVTIGEQLRNVREIVKSALTVDGTDEPDTAAAADGDLPSDAAAPADAAAPTDAPAEADTDSVSDA